MKYIIAFLVVLTLSVAYIIYTEEQALDRSLQICTLLFGSCATVNDELHKAQCKFAEIVCRINVMNGYRFK